MPRRIKQVIRCLFLATMVVLVVRVGYVATETEIGWQTLASQWQHAFVSWTGWLDKPIGEREPLDQAKFWLAEVERVVAAHPDSASIHMGAAWMLDSPDIGFMQAHLRKNRFARFGVAFGMEPDKGTISTAKAQFRELCMKRCLELAERATELEPRNPLWWRMRALLLFEGDVLWSGQEFGPRAKDWIEVLDGCIAHDDKNALYDYLATLALWEESAEYGVEEDTDDFLLLLHINDADRFAQGEERYQRAQEKEYLAIGEQGYHSIAEFLSHCNLSKEQQANAGISRLVTLRHDLGFTQTLRWQNVRSNDASRNEDHTEEIKLCRQKLRLYDQAIIPDESSALSVLTKYAMIRTGTFDYMQELVEEHPDSLTADEFNSIRERERELRTETATLLQALQVLQDDVYPKSNNISAPTILASVSSTSAAILVVAALFFSLLTRLLRSSEQQDVYLGAGRQAIVWTVGCGGTFVALGMAPAEMISHDAQTGAIKLAILALAFCVTLLVSYSIVVVLKRRNYQIRLTTLFAVTTAVAVIAALWPLVDAAFLQLALHPPELWVHAKGWNDIDADVLRAGMQLKTGSLQWATIQWFAYDGVYIGLAVSLALGAFWFMWMSARQASTRLLTFWTRDLRLHWASLFRSIGRSAAAASVCWLLVYLVFAPRSLRESEAHFQYKMRYCRDPHAHWQEIRQAQADIKSDAEEMKRIRESVDFELGQEELLEEDFSTE